MNFSFATTPRVVFGAGAVARAGEIVRGLGYRRAFVVTGRSTARAARVIDALEQGGIATETCAVAGEPTVGDVVNGTARAKAFAPDVVVATGGGSAIDSGKAIAALVANDGALEDYLETIGAARPLERRALPVVAIPTTAGTGSEVTHNAVVTSPEHRVKVSIRHVSMLPAVAVVDPDLAVDLPPDLTVATGLDALTQLIEPYVSIRHTPVTDILAVEGMRRAAAGLAAAVRDGKNIQARSDMALAALFSGMCLANAGLGAVHGLAGPLGGFLGAPHGAICAALLPHVMAANVAAFRAQGRADGLARYDDVARVLTGQPAATADAGVAWVRELVRELGVPGLSTYGLTEELIPDVIEPARRASSMKGNAIGLSDGELTTILAAAR